VLPGAPPPVMGGPDRHAAIAWAAAALAGLGAILLVPGGVGVVIGIGCLAIVPRAAGRLETRAERDERDQLARQAPAVVDLLAATLASGATMRTALAAVCAAIDDPARRLFRSVVTGLDLGADPQEAWQSLAEHPVLGPVSAAVVRSSRTGAPLATLLSQVGADLRRERRTVVEVAARTAGIRAVLPLAACFLPAFILLGVVPIVAALASGLLGGA
jgi:Flp pilus assembly protein TadB